MTLIQAIVLGLVQGATEFLPVSSSGHLVLLQYVWGMPEGVRVALTAVLHIGTAAAVVGYFRRRLIGILRGLAARQQESRIQSWLMVGYMAVGSVPAAIVGLLFRHRFEAVFSEPRFVGAMLLATGTLLFATRFKGSGWRGQGWMVALVVGLAQAVAILPGISRSGATIAVAIYLGMTRRDAFEFSFLLSIPVVLGAAVVELRGIDYGLVGVAPVVIGIGVALLAGVGALVLLRRAVLGRWFHWFAGYCWVAGLLVLLLLR